MYPISNPKGGYSYVFDLKETNDDRRAQKLGKARVAKGKRQITRKKTQKAA